MASDRRLHHLVPSDEIKRAAARVTELSLTGAKFAPLDQIPTPPLSGGVSAAASDHSIRAESGTLVVTGSETAVARKSPSSDASSTALFIANLKASISEDQLEPSVQAIRRDLTNIIGPDLKNQFEALLYYSALCNVALTHERNYNAIFGSQLQLLAQMNVTLGVPPSVARQIYDAAKSANPEVYRAFPFEQWLAFLQRGGLITDAPNGNYVLTSYGRGFLRYILDRHLSVNKPF
jgi:hypothetical protein